jgi:hypothetical protein
MQTSEKREIKAVHTADLTDLLKKFGHYDNFTNNQIKCNVCLVAISQSNLGSIKLKDNQLIFTCNKSSCYNEIIAKKFQNM